MRQNQSSYPPQYFSSSSFPPSQSTYYPYPAFYPSQNHGGYNNYWGQDQTHTLVYIANQMNAGPSSAGLATPTTSNNQCKWLTSGTPCNQIFTSFEELVGHLGTLHDVQGTASRKLVCQWQLTDGWPCGKEYRRDGYKRHIGVHVGLSVPCPDCDKRFSRDDSMRAHWKKFHGKA